MTTLADQQPATPDPFVPTGPTARVGQWAPAKVEPDQCWPFSKGFVEAVGPNPVEKRIDEAARPELQKAYQEGCEFEREMDRLFCSSLATRSGDLLAVGFFGLRGVLVCLVMTLLMVNEHDASPAICWGVASILMISVSSAILGRASGLDRAARELKQD